MSKKKEKQSVCVRCDKSPVKKDVCCEPCYEEMRKALLDEVSRRDLQIIQQNTQISILQETVRNQAALLAAGEKKTKARKTA